MKRYIKNIIPSAVLLLSIGFSSCIGDLDVTPIDPNKNMDLDPEALFNMCYANFALEGVEGPGKANIAADDPGTTGLVRELFNANELTTDEAICAWTDPGVTTMNTNEQDASNTFLAIYYNRLYSGISVCNQYLTVAADVDATRTAEIRFIRALQFYLAMDAFGNIPVPTMISNEKPVQETQAQVYAWLEKELLEIEPLMSQPSVKKSTDAGYGRVDKAAAWMLLSRLYLNAEVYTGTAQWAKAAEYAKKVIDSPYQLYTVATGNYSAYQKLFMGDNGESGASVEAIFPVLQQGNRTAAYGCTTFLTASTHTSDMKSNGLNAAWGGNRARKELIQKFFPNNDAPVGEPADLIAAAKDDRALFWSKDRTLDIETTDQVKDFKKGFSVTKFTNIKSDGSNGTDTGFSDADFFFFRTAEAYLTYAEATARLNGGRATAEGIAYLNRLRTRSHAVNKAGYSLNDILDERAREFYFEGQRRTDLIRYDKFGGETDYLWTWKGGTANGRNFDKRRNIFPLPASDLSVNENLKQNPGYGS